MLGRIAHSLNPDFNFPGGITGFKLGPGEVVRKVIRVVVNVFSFIAYLFSPWKRFGLQMPSKVKATIKQYQSPTIKAVQKKLRSEFKETAKDLIGYAIKQIVAPQLRTTPVEVLVSHPEMATLWDKIPRTQIAEVDALADEVKQKLPALICADIARNGEAIVELMMQSLAKMVVSPGLRTTLQGIMDTIFTHIHNRANPGAHSSEGVASIEAPVDALLAFLPKEAEFFEKLDLSPGVYELLSKGKGIAMGKMSPETATKVEECSQQLLEDTKALAKEAAYNLFILVLKSQIVSAIHTRLHEIAKPENLKRIMADEILPNMCRQSEKRFFTQMVVDNISALTPYLKDLLDRPQEEQAIIRKMINEVILAQPHDHLCLVAGADDHHVFNARYYDIFVPVITDIVSVLRDVRKKHGESLLSRESIEAIVKEFLNPRLPRECDAEMDNRWSQLISDVLKLNPELGWITSNLLDFFRFDIGHLIALSLQEYHKSPHLVVNYLLDNLCEQKQEMSTLFKAKIDSFNQPTSEAEPEDVDVKFAASVEKVSLVMRNVVLYKIGRLPGGWLLNFFIEKLSLGHSLVKRIQALFNGCYNRLLGNEATNCAFLNTLQVKLFGGVFQKSPTTATLKKSSIQVHTEAPNLRYSRLYEVVQRAIRTHVISNFDLNVAPHLLKLKRFVQQRPKLLAELQSIHPAIHKITLIAKGSLSTRLRTQLSRNIGNVSGKIMQRALQVVVRLDETQAYSALVDKVRRELMGWLRGIRDNTIQPVEDPARLVLENVDQLKNRLFRLLFTDDGVKGNIQAGFDAMIADLLKLDPNLENLRISVMEVMQLIAPKSIPKLILRDSELKDMRYQLFECVVKDSVRAALVAATDPEVIKKMCAKSLRELRTSQKSFAMGKVADESGENVAKLLSIARALAKIAGYNGWSYRSILSVLNLLLQSGWVNPKVSGLFTEFRRSPDRIIDLITDRLENPPLPQNNDADLDSEIREIVKQLEILIQSKVGAFIQRKTVGDRKYLEERIHQIIDKMVTRDHLRALVLNTSFG